MSLYARPSWQLARQVGADAFVVLWAIGWFGVSRAADATIRLLAVPARETAQAAEAMRDNLRRAGENAGRVPGVGPDIQGPIDDTADNLEQVIGSAYQQVHGIEQVATLAGVLVFLIPVLVLVAVWLPRRIAFHRTSSAAQRFIDSSADLDLFALRAMATQPMAELARVSDDPVRDWRDGDRAVINRLADLELRRSGLRAPRQLDR